MQSSRRFSRWLIWGAALVLGFAMGALIEAFLMRQVLKRHQDFMIHHHMLSPEMRGNRPPIPEHKRELERSGLRRTVGPAAPAAMPPRPA